MTHVYTEDKLLYIPDGLLTPLSPSTATIQGTFTNVELSSDIINVFILSGNIISATSNEGTIYNPTYVAPPPQQKKSKRGRKKIVKAKTKRCQNGAFGSMIQFVIKNPNKPGKVFKIKAFNKETFQIPGVLDPSFKDVMPALHELAELLELYLGCDPIIIKNIKPLMRNYICKISSPIYKIDLDRFARFIFNYQKSDAVKTELIEKLRQHSTFRHNNLIQEISDYISPNHMGINSIQYDLEKYAGIKIKFKRPLHIISKSKDEYKNITVKIYQSGKINIDGGKLIDEIEELYFWLNNVFMTNRDHLLIDCSRSFDSTNKRSQKHTVSIADIELNQNYDDEIRKINLDVNAFVNKTHRGDDDGAESDVGSEFNDPVE